MPVWFRPPRRAAVAGPDVGSSRSAAVDRKAWRQPASDGRISGASARSPITLAMACGGGQGELEKEKEGKKD